MWGFKKKSESSLRQQACETLVLLQAAPVFLLSYEVQRLPENLDIYFGPPDEFFLGCETQDPGNPYTRGRLIPILDDGNFGVITFYDPDTRSLIQMDIESPGEVLEVFHSWQQYLADLMIGIAESGEDDGQVRRIVELVQFRHANELLEFCKMSHTDFEAARRQFISTIG